MSESRLILTLHIAWAVACGSIAAESDPSRQPAAAASPIDFVRDIQPIFARHCYSCHGPEKQKNDFRLDVKSIALQGGASGPAIVAGKSAESRLIQYVSGNPKDKRMPQKGERLTLEEIERLRVWIDQGAFWPDGLDPKDFTDRQNHWAFQPVRRPPIPAVTRKDWGRNPIDHFILAQLERENLEPAPEADKGTLIRRLYFDLIGLPPTTEEVQQYVADDSGLAYENIVERLLASLHYGERWARHWLDVVRFAESNGFETNTERPNAWPYRDYVIAAFNEDKRYDQFILEQLAGDALRVDAATGFLVGGPYDAVKSPDINLTLQQRMDELHDMVSTTGSAFLGLTVGCARCHDHKFDPISQTDYYSMQAIFAGVQHGERSIPTPDANERMQKAERERQAIATLDAQLSQFEPLANPDIAKSAEPKSSHSKAGAANEGAEALGSGKAGAGDGPPLRSAVHPRQNVERFGAMRARYLRFTVLETTSAEPCLDELEVYTAEQTPRNIALASAGTKATASGSYAGNPFHKLEHIHDGRYGNAYSWISDTAGKGWVQLEFPETVTIDRVVWGRDREEKYADRLATQYQIEVAVVAGQWKLVASAADRERYVPGAKPKPVYSQARLSDRERTELNRLRQEKARHEMELKRLTTAAAIYAGRFEQPGPTYRLQRGEALQTREQVNPAAIHHLGPELELSVNSLEQQRRLALGRWIIDPRNPLTTRVMVNRIWHYHFGQGIVSTPSDFGHMGARPTHPELLDWLATEFLAGGWSVKHIQRLIVLSSTFRQSSRATAQGVKLDASTRWLWRFPPQRLEAEPIRDAILSVSGNLDLRMGGPGFDLFESNNNYVKVYNPRQEFGPAEWRRMIYQSKPRMRLDDIFGAFDCPDAGQTAPRRNVSTTPLQALNLLNSRFLLQEAEYFGRRLEKEAGPDPDAQAQRAFWLAFARPAWPAEQTASAQFIRAEGLRIFCRALFNANEFVYVF